METTANSKKRSNCIIDGAQPLLIGRRPLPSMYDDKRMQMTANV